MEQEHYILKYITFTSSGIQTTKKEFFSEEKLLTYILTNKDIDIDSCF